MKKTASKVARIHLSIDQEHFEGLEEVAAKMKTPGNAAPSPQAIVRIAVAEFLEKWKSECTE